MQWKHTLLTLLILILLPFSYAAEDFVAGVKSASLDVCTASHHVQKVTIQNTGDRSSQYAVVVQGEAKPYTTIMPETFSLGVGKQKTVDIIYGIPSGKEGNYDTSIVVMTAGGLQKQILQDIDAKRCNNNFLLALNFNQTACPCLDMTYDLRLKNTGQFKERYTFGLDKFSEYATLSANPLVLEPGESKDIKLTFHLACGIYGEHLVNFFSNAENSGVRTRVPLLLNINRCYDYDLNTGKTLPDDDAKFDAAFESHSNSYDICAGDDTSIQLQVDNSGYIPNNFSYAVEGPEWGSLYTDSQRLEGKEQGMDFLDLKPSLDMRGDYSFVVSTDTAFGQEKRQEIVDISVNQCYGLITETTDEQICSCVPVEIPFSIWNTGNFNEDVQLQVEGPGFLNVSAGSINVGAGATEYGSLIVQPDCNTRGIYDFKIKASLENGNAYAEDIKRLEVIPIESCYDVKMENSRTHRVLYETSIIPITLIHEGTKEAIYTVVKEGEEWISIDADQFTLKPGERFAFNVIAQPGNVSEDNYYVNLKMQTSAVEYKKVLKLKLREDESFLHKTGDYISLNRYWIYSGILVLILVVILLTYLRNKAKVWKIRKLIYRARKEEVKKKAVKKTKKAVKKKKREPTNWKVIIIGGIIAVVLGLLATYTPYLTIFWGAIVSAAIEYGLYVIIGVLILIILLAILNKVEE